ncbi:hypothetical protein RYX36_012868 [Vicia faba]
MNGAVVVRIGDGAVGLCRVRRVQQRLRLKVFWMLTSGAVKSVAVVGGYCVAFRVTEAPRMERLNTVVDSCDSAAVSWWWRIGFHLLDSFSFATLTSE